MSIPLQQVGVRQRKMEYLHFRVDISDVSGSVYSTTGLDEGTYHATIKKTAAGVSSIILNKAARRNPIIVGITSVGADEAAGTADVRFSATVTNSTITVISELGGTDADYDYHLVLAVPRVASQQ